MPGRPSVLHEIVHRARPATSAVLGNEYAGVVKAVGSGVTAFSVGEKVFGYNEGPFGAHAQYLAIPEDASITTMPANLSYVEAAPSTEGLHYALAPNRRARITSGQDVLVYGATGAIGSAAVQLLKSLDVNVTAVCGTAQLDWLRAWARTGSSTTPLRISLRTSSATTWSLTRWARVPSARCRPLLKPAGIYVPSELGPYAQNPFLALIGLRAARKAGHVPHPET